MKITKFLRTCAVSASLAVLSTGAIQAANVTAIDVQGGQAASDSRDFMLGWSFDVTSSITVNALGLFDVGSDGFSQEYRVGLFDSGGSLLADGMVDHTDDFVASGNALGDWYFQSISDVVLSVGKYTIAYFRPGGSDQWLFFTSGVTTSSSITMGDRLEQIGNAFVAPTVETGNSDGHFGPNFLYEDVSAVPVPAGLPLMLAGLGAFGLLRSRRKS